MPEAQAAVALVHAREPADSILLMRRALRDGDPWSGHWCVPGGRRDPKDSGLLETALRELAEECGIRLTPADLETPLEAAPAGRSGHHRIWVAPFVFRVDREFATTLDAAEAEEGLWIPVRVLRDPARHALRPVPGQPAEFRFPAIDLNIAPLWGFTYRLIANWLGLTPHGASVEDAGCGVARTIVEYLLQRGLSVRREWQERRIVLDGPIPAAEVLNRFTGPGPFVHAVNMLEVRPERIRVLGLGYEEYSIEAEGSKT
jgi:8-oxo-dGTP pyrophosphatase MutT (NUDIX family)